MDITKVKHTLAIAVQDYKVKMDIVTIEDYKVKLAIHFNKVANCNYINYYFMDCYTLINNEV